MVQNEIEREVRIEAPPERVWTLLTDSEHVGTWFGDAGAEVDLRPGGTMVLRWTEHGSAQARFERIEPHSFLSYRWAPFRDPGGVEPADGNSTLVEFSLVPDGDATRLKVVESGFAELSTTPEQQGKNVESNREGWQMELGELVDYATRAEATSER